MSLLAHSLLKLILASNKLRNKTTIEGISHLHVGVKRQCFPYQELPASFTESKGPNIFKHPTNNDNAST